jgi:hypothetical protein
VSAPRSVAIRQVDEALERADVRAEFDAYKRLFADGTAVPPWRDPEAHESAGVAAGIQLHRVVELILGDRDSLLWEATYRHLANVAIREMLPPSPEGQRRPELGVTLPPGRPKGRRPDKRQALIDEIRARPDMTDADIDRRGVELGWWEDFAGDYSTIAKRVARLRSDATK